MWVSDQNTWAKFVVCVSTFVNLIYRVLLLLLNMVNINEFIVKPVPKKNEDVILNIQNEDLREEKRINRDEVIERLQRLLKGLSVESLKIDKAEEEEEEEDKYKDDEKEEEKKNEKRLTKKQTSVQENIRSITFSD